MKLQLSAVAAAAVLPLCSTLAIQDVLSDDKDSNLKQVSPSNIQNPLDSALESSPAFLNPADVDNTNFDLDAEINRLISSTAHDIDTWIKDLINHPLDEITNLPSELTDIDIPIDPTDLSHPPTPNKTIYELISESKYTTILAKIINSDPDLVDYLNSTEHKFTFFAPTDHAFKKIPHRHHHKDHDGHDDDGGDDDDHHRIPKEVVHAILRYHSSHEVLNAAQLFHRHTIASALEDPLLGTIKPDEDDDDEEALPQRIAVRAGFRGLTLNFYSHIVAAGIPATNGLIHGIDSILLPPPPALLLLDVLPTKFSTFNLALYKTSLVDKLNTSSESSGKGFTLFTPTNSAFAHLGLKINAFLFSPPGLKYLRGLLKYHIVPNRTLYSDVLYTESGEIKPFGVKGATHLDLPTLLGDHKIAVDVAHLGPYVSFKLNGWQRVAFADALVKDGVIHVLDHVLIPPRRLEKTGGEELSGEEEELTVEELIERLEPWVEDDKVEGEAGFDAILEEIVRRVEDL
ncbi:FAS1 domain-containing protein [Aspergillus pseudoustus]|uniref:FAS1 domain-containing protein n=1 Tax=Aspergillus pseudoustus TaxID=1810923 RepID=A0ABR4JD91_9EURO